MTKSMTVTLASLEHDPHAIEGHEHRLTQIDDLLASIPVKGQLQSLRVRAWNGKKKAGVEWGVIAGNRRLATLRALLKDKAEVEGVKVTGEFKVHVIVGAENDVDAYEASVAENVMRLPPTPVEQFRAFKRMADTTPAAEIARHFGVTERLVQQRMSLAALHPDVLAALEKGKIGIEAAQAFTLEPDPKRQAAHLKKTPEWQLHAHNIRAAFTDKLVRGDSDIAKLLTRKTYEAAGGKILGDAFDEKASYWTSTDIVEQLLQQRSIALVDKWLEEGWLFVERLDEFGGGKNQWGGYKAFDAKRLEFLPRKRSYTAEQKAIAGVVYDPLGKREPLFGVVKPGTKIPSAARPKSSAPAVEAKLDDVGPNTTLALSEIATKALRAKVAKDGDMALTILLASLHAQTMTEYDRTNAIGINAGACLACRDDSEDDDDDGVDLDELEDVKMDAALKLMRGKSRAEQLQALAVIVAANLSVREGSAGSRNGVLGLMAYVDPDTGALFDADAYFAGITKPLIQLAWRDMTEPDVARLADAKKAEMAATAASEAKRVGWLPPQLRTPSYAGPQHLTVPAAQLQAAE